MAGENTKPRQNVIVKLAGENTKPRQHKKYCLTNNQILQNHYHLYLYHG